MQNTTIATPNDKGLSLLLCSSATALLIGLETFIAGLACWIAGVIATACVRDRDFRAGMYVMFGCILALAFAPINTDRSNLHFLQLGAFFAAAIILPTYLLRRMRPHWIEWNFLPKKFQWADIAYTALSIPITWLIVRWYFTAPHLAPIAQSWPMPDTYTQDGFWRLFVGINLVGIWDELFFVNTVYGIYRQLFSRRIAILAQAVVYTSVLYNMAFTGIGPVLIFIFALTQGIMYEKSRCLLYVLIVHLIVDAFLVHYILNYYYPGQHSLCLI